MRPDDNTPVSPLTKVEVTNAIPDHNHDQSLAPLRFFTPPNLAILATLIAAIVCFNHFYGFNPRLWRLPSSPETRIDLPIGYITQEPAQTILDPPIDLTARWQYRMTAIATYSITARVLSTHDYSYSDFGDLIPLDFALGWSRMADVATSPDFKIYQHSRWYFWQYKNSPPLPPDEINQSSANTHIIPANDEIYRKLLSVHVGQIINLRGYLMQIENPGRWTIRSSTSRTDTGRGACEVMFVQSINIIEDK